MAIDIKSLLKIMLEKNASDFHVTANTPIHLRIDENLHALNKEILSPQDTKASVYAILNDDQIKQFEKDLELDFSFELKDIARFRVNIFYQRGAVGCAIRLIPYEIMNFEQCGLPVKTTTKLCKVPKGLVLITGATGSGKSTTLASMVDYINSNRPCHIITIEDPIEFVHKNRKAIVDQREVYKDTHSFGASLKRVLRQDPDVILIGEMRDLETIESALIIAETGHLVLATLHTSDAVQTINRIIDVFPAHQQQQIRTQLSFVLSGVLSQQLIPKAGKSGRALATEVLIATPAIRSLIREGKVHQIYSVIQTTQKEGMKTMNQALADLCESGAVSLEACQEKSTNIDELYKLIKSPVKGKAS
ncbi:MAG: type IV pilus twitching motility protein PilT [Candidatus Omnitrophica bacterium]|nr:type IV pilus twitching motility protein PilT [Candidatus Omnitrophota bacterium]